MTYEQLLNRQQQLEFELEHYDLHDYDRKWKYDELSRVKRQIEKMEENKT